MHSSISITQVFKGWFGVRMTYLNHHSRHYNLNYFPDPELLRLCRDNFSSLFAQKLQASPTPSLLSNSGQHKSLQNTGL